MSNADRQTVLMQTKTQSRESHDASNLSDTTNDKANEMRRCLWCKRPLQHMRADARYCSNSCKVMACRARKARKEASASCNDDGTLAKR